MTGLLLALGFLSPITSLFFHHFNLLGPSELFPLSLWGIHKGYVWQVVSYLFVLPGVLTFFSLINLLFNLFILWVAGSLLIDEFGSKRFLFLFFGSAIFSACMALIVMTFLSYHTFLAGLSPVIYALLFTISMRMPDLQAAFFFIVRVKIKWIIFILIGLSLLTSLLSADWVFFIAESAGIIFAYFFGVIFLHLKSPFSFTHAFDRFMHRHSSSLFSLFKKKPKSEKIVNLYDETFMDKMLEKISKNGEDALSKSELRRMKKISKKKEK